MGQPLLELGEQEAAGGVGAEVRAQLGRAAGERAAYSFVQSLSSIHLANAG
jgi:hypothetical protein